MNETEESKGMEEMAKIISVAIIGYWVVSSIWAILNIYRVVAI